jgi:hypothetical protein
MRISESRIRRIIREEIEKQVDEMAYAGNLGVRHSPDQESTSFFSDEVALEPNRPGAEKFARSGRFKTLAGKHLANIPGNVWIAPLIGVADDVYDSVEGTRVKMVPLVPDGIERLEDLGYEAPARVGGDDIVILYATMSTGPDIMATPWMIFHAMFDSGESAANVCPSFMELIMGLLYGETDDPELTPIASDFDDKWFGALTMKSARDGRIQAPTDAFAEIMCQELLTSGGFQINDRGAAPKYVKALHALKPYIKRCADEFRQRIRGKLVTVAVN